MPIPKLSPKNELPKISELNKLFILSSVFYYNDSSNYGILAYQQIEMREIK